MASDTGRKNLKKYGKRKVSWQRILPHYIMLIPAVAAVSVFAYLPMLGLLAAFKDYDIWKGFIDSPWTDQYGMKYFIQIFQNKELMGSIWYTVKLSLLNLCTTFPLQLILALLFNELSGKWFKKTVQTITYMPHFLSWISIIGLATVVLDEYGLVNEIMLLINPDHERTLFLSKQELFTPLLVFLNNWREVGYGSIFFLAAIASIDPQLYEAAAVDGAGRWKQALHITLPGISSTAIVLMILSIGGILGSNFDLVYGLKNPYIDVQTIDTVVYELGLGSGQFSLTIALGLARGLIALVLTLVVNAISRKVNEVSIL